MKLLRPSLYGCLASLFIACHAVSAQDGGRQASADTPRADSSDLWRHPLRMAEGDSWHDAPGTASRKTGQDSSTQAARAGAPQARGEGDAPSGNGYSYEEEAPPNGWLPDAKAYVLSPLHWDSKEWLYLGGSLAAIAASHHYDSQVRTHFTTGRYASNLTTQSSSDLKDAIPGLAAIAGTWIYSSLVDDNSGRREAGNMVEAAVFGTVSAFVLRTPLGRVRPSQTSDPNKWGGSGSFPSIHATAAFAIGTVLAESGSDDVRWIRRVIGYGIGAGTAYERLRHNSHWLSDTVAGAALGIATAHFVMNRHGTQDYSNQVMVRPLDGGVMLTYSKSWQ